MATKLFLKNTTENGIAGYYDMVTTAGASSDTGVVNTTASGTEIQWTKTAGGTAMAWISGRVPSGGFTLTTTDISIWAHESGTGANAGGRYRVYKYSGGVETEIAGGPFSDGVEFTKNTPTEMTWTGDVTDTAFAENDRIVVKLFITNVGTMGGSLTCTLTFNAADAATGDSFFNINETVSFKAEEGTLIVYPDPDPESTSVDGDITNTDTNVTWATIHDNTSSDFAGSTHAQRTFVEILAGTSSDRWSEIIRGYFLFDTSAIGSGQQVDSGTFSLWIVDKGSNQLSQSVALCSPNPASNTNLVVGDYNIANWDTTELATAVDITGVTTGQYTDWTLNTAGKSAIAMEGITKLGILCSSDRANTPPTWGSGQISYLNGYLADQTGTSNDPKLVIEYSPVAGTALKDIISGYIPFAR